MVLHKKVEKVFMLLETEGTIFFMVVMSSKKEWDGRTLISACDFHVTLQEFDLRNWIQEYLLQVKYFSRFCM